MTPIPWSNVAALGILFGFGAFVVYLTYRLIKEKVL